MSAAGEHAVVGWIGLSQMGMSMCGNLVDAGVRVHVWNRTASKADPLLAKGAVLAPSPLEVVKAATVTFVMLDTQEANKEIYEREDGILEGVEDGKVIVDCATVGAAAMIESCASVEQKGARFLEAPVAGHSGMAAEKSIAFLCGGTPDTHDVVQPLMLKMGKKADLVGAVGEGSRLKLVINGMLGNMGAVMAESLALCESSGVDTDVFLSIVENHPMGNPFFKLQAQNMMSNRHDPLFMTKHASKDLKLACEMGEQYGLPLRLTRASQELMAAAVDQGHGDKHMSAVYEAVKESRRS